MTPETKIINEVWSNENFVYDLRQYRAPFEVYAAEWNNRFDLLALASRSGVVLVKRFYWKIGWKKELSSELGTLIQNESPISFPTKLEAISWSPNGDILAVSMSNGLLHLLDAQFGKIRYTLHLEDSIRILKWFSMLSEESHVLDEIDLLFSTISTNDFKVNEETNPECVQKISDMEDFFNSTLSKSLHGTFLFGIATNSPMIYVIASGIVPIFNLRPELDNMEGIDPMSAEILDVLCLSSQKIQVVCNYTGYGKPTFSNELGLSTDHSIGTNTYVVEYDLGWTKNKSVNFFGRISLSLYKLCYLNVYIHEMYQHAIHSWEPQSHFFHNRLLGKGQLALDEYTRLKNEDPRDFLQELLLLTLTGTILPPMNDFFHKDLQANGLKSLNEFVDEQFPILSRGLSCILSAARLMQLYTNQLYDEYIEFANITRCCAEVNIEKLEDLNDIETVLNLFNDSLNQHLKDAFQMLIQSSLTIQQRVSEISLVAEENRGYLKFYPNAMTILIHKTNLVPDYTSTASSNCTKNALNKCLMDRILPYLKDEESQITLEECPLAIKFDSKLNTERILAMIKQNTNLQRIVNTCSSSLEKIWKYLRDGYPLEIKLTSVYKIDIVHPSPITRAYLIDWQNLRAQIEMDSDRLHVDVDSNELLKLMDKLRPYECQSFLLELPSGVLIELPNSNPADPKKVLVSTSLGNSGRAQMSEKAPKEPLTVFINGLEKGAPYHILEIHPYTMGKFFGLIRLLDGERAGQIFLFRANIFDRKAYIDLNTSLFSDIEMVRLSEKRALGIVVASCKTRLIWFDLEGDYEETQVDEDGVDIDDEECFTDAVEHIETDSTESVYEERPLPLRFDSPIHNNTS